MKSITKILFFVCTLLLAVSCGQQRSQAYYDYESKIIQSHADGSYVIRAWGRSRNAAMSYDVAQIQALRDVIFKGVQPASSNIQPLKPLCFDMNAETKYEDYFNAFFSDKGEWIKCVLLQHGKKIQVHIWPDHLRHRSLLLRAGLLALQPLSTVACKPSPNE